MCLRMNRRLFHYLIWRRTYWLLLQNEPMLKIREIAANLDTGESKIKHATVRLKKRGLLSRSGSKQSSYWKVNL